MAARSSELQKAVDRLLEREPRWKAATSPPAKGGRPGGVSTGRPASAGGGSASLIEEDYTGREYHPAVTVTTSDGVFTFEVEPIKSVTWESGDKMIFAAPPAPAP